MEESFKNNFEEEFHKAVQVCTPAELPYKIAEAYQNGIEHALWSAKSRLLKMTPEALKSFTTMLLFCECQSSSTIKLGRQVYSNSSQFFNNDQLNSSAIWDCCFNCKLGTSMAQELAGNVARGSRKWFKYIKIRNFHDSYLLTLSHLKNAKLTFLDASFDSVKDFEAATKHLCMEVEECRIGLPAIDCFSLLNSLPVKTKESFTITASCGPGKNPFFRQLLRTFTTPKITITLAFGNVHNNLHIAIFVRTIFVWIKNNSTESVREVKVEVKFSSLSCVSWPGSEISDIKAYSSNSVPTFKCFLSLDSQGFTPAAIFLEPMSTVLLTNNFK